MEAFIKAVCDDFLDDFKGSFEPEDQVVVKETISRSIIRNKKLLPDEADESESPAINFKNKIDTGKTTTVSAYNLHWNDWKQYNNQKEYPDPNDPKQKLTQHKYWKKFVWDPLPKEEKKPWDDKARQIRDELKKTTGTKVKRKVSKSGFQLFLEKEKSMMEKDEEFTHPETGSTIKLHHFLLYIWSTYVKDNEDLNVEFNETAGRLKNGDLDDYDLNDLPYIDPDKLRQQEFDDLVMIKDE
jgi:hypothetical protein